MKLSGRVALMVAGSTVSSVCYAVTIKARLGLGPLFVVQDGLSRQLGFSIGTAVMVTGVACLVLGLTLRATPGPATVLLPFLGGYTLDHVLHWTPVVSGAIPRIVGVLVATWLMALGGALIIRAAVGIAPYDLVMVGICKTLDRKVGGVRLLMELSMLVSGWLLGGTVGVGTVATGLLIGPSLQFWLRKLGVTGFRTQPTSG